MHKARCKLRRRVTCPKAIWGLFHRAAVMPLSK
jgi:hypothetical protein